MGASAFSDRVNKLTREKIIPSVVDTVNRSNYVTAAVLSKPKSWNGRVITQPLTVANDAQGESFKGAHTFNTAITFAPINFSWYATGFGQPVANSLPELGANQTEAGQIELRRANFEWAQNSMANRLGTIFYGTGSGDDFDGLGLIVDDATATSSYGGLARSTYGSFINADVNAASGGVLDLDLMDTTDDSATVSGLISEEPNAVITTKSVFSLYGSLLSPTVQATYQVMGGTSVSPNTNPSVGNGFSGAAGFRSLTYRGKDVIRDEKQTSGVMIFLNTSQLEFDSLKIPGLKSVGLSNSVTEGVYDKTSIKNTAFQWRDYMEPINQLAEVGIFVIYGNLIHRNPQRNSKITGITGV